MENSKQIKEGENNQETPKSSPLISSIASRQGDATGMERGGELSDKGLSVKQSVDRSKMQMEFAEFMAEVGKLSKEDKAHHLERLVSQKYINPHDVLEVGPEASEAEIKRKYRMLSIMVHPDKNKHDQEKARDAFGQLEKAYRLLTDVDKRRTF